MEEHNMNGYLLLEDGTTYSGTIIGYPHNEIGEVVFNTGMTGYQEILTDPSYYGQIVTMTYPLIGNYGINSHDSQSKKPMVRGFIVKEASDIFTNFRSEKSLQDYLYENKIIGLVGIDTRSLVKKIRTTGTMNGKIIINELDADKHIEEIRAFTNLDVAKIVSTKEDYIIPGTKGKIAVLDYGIKQHILDSLSNLGYELKVFSYYTDLSEIEAYKPDGIFLSNGPGDPSTLDEAIAKAKGLIGKYPIFGICLGHQLLWLALGGQTKKMKFGHRGSNHPVKDSKLNRIFITSQNHSYEIIEESLNDSAIEITHRNVNDKTVEGFRSKSLNILSVQYHPEASPGPSDSMYLFDEFKEMIENFNK
jgi:carbamoyl-phosphate synthase small subunit